MENASKALIIAGGILISMLVISIGVYLFANYGNVSLSYDKNMETIEIQKFNSNFTKFEGRDNITIQEIVTLVNYCKEYKDNTQIHVMINIPRCSDVLNYFYQGPLDKKNERIIGLIYEYQGTSFTFLEARDEDSDGRIDYIFFTW